MIQRTENLKQLLGKCDGKDKPVDRGHDEAAWAKNRRC
jgi:outer membrane protein OmpA-like peptidoglycan-associated protein